LKREALAKQKKKQKNGILPAASSSFSAAAATSQSVPDFGYDSVGPDLMTHARTLSSTSSIPSVSPATLIHKVSHNDPGDGSHAGTETER
jgi:hypothetical protein